MLLEKDSWLGAGSWGEELNEALVGKEMKDELDYGRPRGPEIRDETEWPNVNERAAGYIEGYAAGLQDLLKEITKDNNCSKHYDPMIVWNGEVMDSYAFNMKDGGRHHQMSDYSCLGEVLDILLKEVVEIMKD